MNAVKLTTSNESARELQRALYRAAKASSTRRFHALYDKVYRKDILERAWYQLAGTVRWYKATPKVVR